MAPGSVTKAKGGSNKRTKKTPQFHPELVVEWRRSKGLSQGDVAVTLGYDRSSISKMEHGQEPPDKFWRHFKRTFKRVDPRVDFYRRNGAKP